MTATRSLPVSASAAVHEPRLASTAALVADPTRARMLCFLLSGECASAGELARAGSVTAPTASAHLAKLLEAGLVVVEQRGRHRYYRLADADVVAALEALALVAERSSHQREWASPARTRLREARCCYGHLAGRLGVELLDQFVAREWLVTVDGRFVLTATGAEGLNQFGMEGDAWLSKSSSAGTRPIAYPCLDWSERRDHLAGKLASAVLDQMLARGWLRRRCGERALALTPSGQQALGGLFVAQPLLTKWNFQNKEAATARHR